MNLSQTEEEYILSRCAAFYVILASVLAEDGRYPDAELVATSKASAVFEELVIRYANLQKDRDEAMSDVTQFSQAYVADFNKYYIESGQRFDNELFQSDSAICEQLISTR